jgi:hypothetical protein
MRPLFEYDLYFPLSGNGAKPPTTELERIKKELTHFFGGLTDFRHRGEGTWKMGGVTFRDEVILLRVLGEDRDRARQFMRDMQHELKRSLDQVDILVIEREVVALGSP